jgi:hypothetical protein
MDAIGELLSQSILLEQEWGDIVDRREYLSDTPGFGYGRYDQRISSPSDRARGKCYPFYENEQDLASIRGIARFLVGSTELAISALDNLTNYTIGNGFTYSVEARNEDEAEVVSKQVREVQSALDDELERLDWPGNGEAEAFQRAHRDGEAFLWITPIQGKAEILIPEPDYLTEPIPCRDVEDYCGLSGLDWSFGIATDQRSYERRHAYFIQWEGSKSDWEVARADEMVHIRLNVDRGVKRGISDFYAPYLTLERTSKLLGNTLQGAAIQATIAYIREHSAGATSSQIETFRTSKSDGSFSMPKSGGGTKTQHYEKFRPGRVLDTAGMKYHAGPLGSPSGPTYVEVMQAGVRVVGARWQMPEYMISGDASNANYASTLVSGGPFDKATQRRQGKYRKLYAEVCWKVLTILCRFGRFRKIGIDHISQLKRLVQIKVEAPEAAVQDKAAEEQIRAVQHERGVLSLDTWAAKAGLDHKVEVAKGAKPQAAVGAAAPAPGEPLPTQLPGQPPAPQPLPAPALPPRPGLPNQAPPIQPDVDARLNGAQITAAVAVLDGVAAGTTAELAAVELLTAVGILERTARAMVSATKARAKPVPPPAPPPFLAGNKPPEDQTPEKPDAKKSAVAAALESVRTTDEARAILLECEENS